MSRMLEMAKSSRVTMSLGSNGLVIRGKRIQECGRSARGELQPLSQERRHGGGKQGRASVTCSPDRGGMNSLIGMIDAPLPRRYCFGWPKMG